MVRQIIGSLIVLGALGSVCHAETYLEKVAAIDAGKRSITIVVEKKERTFPVDGMVDIQGQVKVGKRLRVTPFKSGLKGIKVGDEVTLTTEKKDGKEVVTKIVVIGVEAKKGK